MSQFNDNGYRAFVCDEAIAQWARVTLDADGRVTTAGLADKGIGVATRETFAAGDPVAVSLNTKPGTIKMIAVEALAAGATVYSEASGKVQDTAQATAFQVGVALEAATADGDIIEVMPQIGDTAAS